MAAKNKIRGNTFEKEVVAAAIASGVKAQRAWGSDGRSMGMHAEVDVLIGKYKVQCKRRKRFPMWLAPNKNVDVQAVRMDRGKPFIVMPLDMFLDFIKE